MPPTIRFFVVVIFSLASIVPLNVLLPSITKLPLTSKFPPSEELFVTVNVSPSVTALVSVFVGNTPPIIASAAILFDAKLDNAKSPVIVRSSTVRVPPTFKFAFIETSPFITTGAVNSASFVTNTLSFA